MTDGLVLSAIAVTHDNKIFDRFSRILMFRRGRLDRKAFSTPS
jgi:predicted ABC-type transport system involved in lysophospholipase L1 biosynthesis ATPase subunit